MRGGRIIVMVDICKRVRLLNAVAVGCAHLSVTPSCGLGDDGLIYPVGYGQVAVLRRSDTKSAVVKAVLIDSVGKEQAKLLACPHFLE